VRQGLVVVLLLLLLIGHTQLKPGAAAAACGSKEQSTGRQDGCGTFWE